MSSTDLTRATTIRALVAAFQEAAQTVRVTFAAIAEAESKLNAVYTLGESHRDIRIDASRGRWANNFADPDDTIERMKRAAWSVIVDRLELRRMMSIKRWNEMEHQLSKGELPAITDENVQAFARGALDSLPEMLTEAVTEVFEWLRPWRSEYKTNSKLEIGRKVVLQYIVERADLRWTWSPRVNYRYTQNLTAMENVFSALDGKGQVSKVHYSALQNAINASAPSCRGETDYFRFRVFKNGNMHLEFKRLDLLDRFNKIAGGKRMRPAKEGADPIPDEAALVVSRTT